MLMAGGGGAGGIENRFRETAAVGDFFVVRWPSWLELVLVGVLLVFG